LYHAMMALIFVFLSGNTISKTKNQAFKTHF